MPFDMHRWVGGAALLIIGVTGCVEAPGQAPYATTLDIIECRPGYERECLYFYENNWKLFREEALDRNFISGYQILRTAPDSISAVTLLLLTEYPDSTTFAETEDNFQPLMGELRPDGPDLLNSVSRSEFVAHRTGFTTWPLDSR